MYNIVTEDAFTGSAEEILPGATFKDVEDAYVAAERLARVLRNEWGTPVVLNPDADNYYLVLASGVDEDVLETVKVVPAR